MNQIRQNAFWIAFFLFVISVFYIFSDLLSNYLLVPNFFKKQFQYGLDISGGSVLTYQADLNQISRNTSEVLEETKDLIERRINSLGVSEVNISYTKSGKIIVEVPGYTDPDKAAQEIGATPLLEFYVPENGTSTKFIPSELTGKYIKKAELQFNPRTYEPNVVIYFDDEGKKIFADLTKKYLGKPIAIYLDKQEISRPVVRDIITEGRAVIEGKFSLEEAKLLTRRLNEGALPVPLNLIGKSAIHPMLGEKFLKLSFISSIIGLVLVMSLLIIFFNLPAILILIILLFYSAYNLALYKILNVTISLAGIAGFLLSLGITIDASILFYARLKEELKKINDKSGERKLDLISLIESSFKNSWPAVRDSNISTLITAFILYSITTSFTKGFALTLFLGTIINLFLVYFINRYILEKFMPHLIKMTK